MKNWPEFYDSWAADDQEQAVCQCPHSHKWIHQDPANNLQKIKHQFSKETIHSPSLILYINYTWKLFLLGLFKNLSCLSNSISSSVLMSPPTPPNSNTRKAAMTTFKKLSRKKIFVVPIWVCFRYWRSHERSTRICRSTPTYIYFSRLQMQRNLEYLWA